MTHEEQKQLDDLCMKQEIMLEALAGLKCDFEKYFKKHNIDRFK